MAVSLNGSDINESVRRLWVCSMHQCASVYLGIVSLISCESSSDEVGHVDTSSARLKSDFIYLSRLLAFHRSNNPFDVAHGELHSLYSGVMASDEDKVNCDQAESVGKCIMAGIDNESSTNVVLKKADRAKMLGQVSKIVVADKHLKADSNLLFSRLIMFAQRRDDIELIFCHQPTAVPAALFLATTVTS